MEMSDRKKKLFFLILGAFVILKITLTVFPLISNKGRLTPSLNKAEAAGDSVSATESTEDEGEGKTPNNQGPTGEPADVSDPSIWLEIVKKREIEMNRREETIRLEEERLKALRREIVEKLNLLQQENERLEAFIEEKTKLIDRKEKKEIKEEERIQQLARIFESTPPEQAGNLLGRLETRIAARIILRMNGKKAGKIWGFVKPDQAVKISQELSKMK